MPPGTAMMSVPKDGHDRFQKKNNSRANKTRPIHSLEPKSVNACNTAMKIGDRRSWHQTAMPCSAVQKGFSTARVAVEFWKEGRAFSKEKRRMSPANKIASQSMDSDPAGTAQSK